MKTEPCGNCGWKYGKTFHVCIANPSTEVDEAFLNRKRKERLALSRQSASDVAGLNRTRDLMMTVSTVG